MPEIGVPELLIIAFIVLLLFGPGKAADLGSSLGKGIREFRRESGNDVALAGPPSLPAPFARFCTECGGRCGTDQKFCSACGTPSTAIP